MDYVLFEKDEAGFTRKAYTRGIGFPGGIGGLISMTRFEMDDDGLEEKTHYYHYDALGSVRGLSNEKGRLSAEFGYDAFGNELKHKGDDRKNAYRFSSKEFEDHAGLYYFGERYYDPEIGRWQTPDPLGFIDGPNVYAYVGNNPTNFIDPLGYEIFGLGFIQPSPNASVAPRPILTPPTPQIVFPVPDSGISIVQSNSQAGKEGALNLQKKTDKESTPQTKPKDFESVRGTKAKRNKNTGEILEKDLFHKNHYEVYKNKKDYEKGRRSREIWEDGRLKGIF